MYLPIAQYCTPTRAGLPCSHPGTLRGCESACPLPGRERQSASRGWCSGAPVRAEKRRQAPDHTARTSPVGALRRPAATGRTRVQGRAAEGVLSSIRASACIVKELVEHTKSWWQGRAMQRVCIPGRVGLSLPSPCTFILRLTPPRTRLRGGGGSHAQQRAVNALTWTQAEVTPAAARLRHACPLPVAAAVRKPPRADLWPIKSRNSRQCLSLSAAGCVCLLRNGRNGKEILQSLVKARKPERGKVST